MGGMGKTIRFVFHAQAVSVKGNEKQGMGYS
jgi:hypothetical protein